MMPRGSVLPRDLPDLSHAVSGRLHHVGFVVQSIPETAPGFAGSLSATWDERIFADPLQQVRVTFLAGAHPGDPLVELIEPNAPDSPVLGFLKKGGGLHHLCYEFASLEKEIDRLQSLGAKLVRPPVPAVAFEGRRIAWIYTKYRLLMELLESKS